MLRLKASEEELAVASRPKRNSESKAAVNRIQAQQHLRIADSPDCLDRITDIDQSAWRSPSQAELDARNALRRDPFYPLRAAH